MDTILQKIHSPSDLKSLEAKDLERLCGEIRRHIVECCSTNPGHLASSLGAVDLTVGIHYVYNAPSDKIIFDVGHQAYAHKILTGRMEAFRKNRMKDGISGFPNRDESEYDAFGVGHASTSISAALGFAEAARIAGRSEKVVAVIGDGAMTGGLALEGLNNAGNSNSDILVILNDNEMAIDGNSGGLHSYLLRLTTNPAYNRFKDRLWNKLGAGKFRQDIQRLVRKTKKGLVTTSGGDLFEAFGLRYFGPIDGNDVGQVVSTLERLKGIGGPKLLHVLTRKGKGYAPAENDPTTWHAPGVFDIATGKRNSTCTGASRYQDVFGEVLCEMAEKDPAVVAITPAMATGSGLAGFAGRFPDRFFDVGIAEEHAATFAAGLAAGGMKPFCSIYSSFAQRAYDEIVHDAALQHLPVVFCFDRAGLVGEDGATHQGVFDLASLRCVPGMVLAAPADENELKDLMYTALNAARGPIVIRYPRGQGEGMDWQNHQPEAIEYGKGSKIRDGERVAVIALGPEVHRAMEAADRIKAATGKSPAIFNARFLKPFDADILRDASEYDYVLTVEEGCLKGGLFSEVAEGLATLGAEAKVKGLGVPDKFIRQDSQKAQREACALDAEGIYSEIIGYFR
ncbi:MAG: 1-deoxy-D-xylulose-5-phosphate synthase [Candidatus Cryptobacteroides sp.]